MDITKPYKFIGFGGPTSTFGRSQKGGEPRMVRGPLADISAPGPPGADMSALGPSTLGALWEAPWRVHISRHFHSLSKNGGPGRFIFGKGGPKGRISGPKGRRARRGPGGAPEGPSGPRRGPGGALRFLGTSKSVFLQC